MRVVTDKAVIGTESENGVLSGVASQVGVMDAYRSVILPGAFNGCLADFLRSGHVCFNHDASRWIGMPTAARMDGRQLRVSAEFYDDDDSQKIRRQIQARQEKSLSTDFSITFMPEWSKTEYFDSGDKLWTYALGLGVDMTLMDPLIKEYRGYCWIIPEVKELAEWGPVTAGATPGAGATGIRSINDLRDGSLADTSLENHLECALAAVQGALARFADYSETRANDGRAVSRDRLSQVNALHSALGELLAASRADVSGLNRLRMEIDLAIAGL